MGQVSRAGCQRIRREAQPGRILAGQGHGSVTVPAGPVPVIGHSCAAVECRAAAVKLNRRTGGNLTVPTGNHRNRGRKPGGHRDRHRVGRGHIRTVRHRQGEDMGHILRAVRPGLRREIRRCRRRAGQGSGGTAGSARPGPGIGQRGSAAVNRRATAVKRHSRAGANRPGIARFRNRGRKPGGHRDRHRVGRGHIRTVRHRQGEDMGHILRAVRPGLRRETRRCRRRAGQGSGGTAGSARPGPGIGQRGSAAVNRRATAVKRHSRAGANRPGIARFRNRGRKPGGHRDRHRVGRGHIRTVRHRQGENMGHILRAVRPGLRRETRRCRRRAGQGSGGTAGSARPGPRIGQRGSAAVNRRATAVKRHSRAGANRPGIARFRNRVHKPGGHRDRHRVGRGHIRTVRHRQGENMGHILRAVRPGLRREIRRCRRRAGQGSGGTAGSARPGPRIGQRGSAAVNRRATAVKRHSRAGANRPGIARFRNRGRKPGGHRDRHRVGRGHIRTVRHRQGEDMGHILRAVRPGLRREIRRCRRRAGQGSGGTAGSARPGPGIGQRGSAAVNRRATAVKRHSRAGANRPGIARFRNRGRKPGGHRDRHRVGRGHIRTVRHRQGEDMGHILRAVRPGLRRETRRCRRRAGQGSGGTAGSARPGPRIGQRGSAAVNRRATAVKRHSRAGANRPGIARFRNRVHKPGGHRDRHRVGRGHIRTVRHRQGENMGHIFRAVRPGLRREIRRCRRRAGQGSGGTAGSARPSPGIGQRGSAAVNRRATAVKRHSRAGANRPGIARFRNRVHKPGGHRDRHRVGRGHIRTVRHRQGENMGHILRAVRPGLRREIRRCRRRAGQGSGGTAGSARPGPRIGQRGSAAVNRRATAVKRHSRAGANRPGIARFRNRGRKPGGHRDRHRVGRGHIRTVRHRQGEDMGHILRAVRPGLRRETRRCRRRAGQGSGGTAGSARPGPGIGQRGSAAVNRRATAVKRHSRAGANRPGIARFRNRGRKPGGHRDRHRVGRGHIRTVRHRQGEDMGHIFRAVRPGLRREIRRCRRRAGQGSGGTAGSARPGPGIGQRGSAAVNRRATAVKRHSRAGANRPGIARFRNRVHKPGGHRDRHRVGRGHIRTVRHRQGEDMGHILRAVRPGLRREIRRCRRRAGQGSGGTAGSARPGPGIGQRGSAAVNRRATAVKRHSRAGANRPGIARFRNRVHKPGGHRDRHRVGRGHIRTVRHRQGEDMGHILRAVRPGLRREIRRCRRRAGQGSGGTAGSARPGPGIGQRGSAAVNRRATAVKRHSRAGANRPGIARFRNRVHKPGGHRDRHRVGRGHIRTVRHRQGEDMGHILRAVRPGLRREIRRCRRRAGQGSGGTAGSARPSPGIGQRGSAAVNRRATAVKRHSRAGANRPGIARFRNRVHKPGGHRDRHRVGRGHIRTVRHRQGEDMGHILRAVRPGLRREIRRCRRRAGQGSGGTAGSARPGPGIGQRGSAAVNRRATAVKRHSRAGANRPGIARFRNRVHKPGGHRDRHRVGRGHIRTVRHRQGEDMGHILRAVRPGLRRETRRCRRRAGQGSGGTAGSARPGPGIGQRGSAAVNRRATAVKRHSRAGANRPGIARFRNRVHKPGGHRDRHRVGRGHIRTVRHRQGEDMGHILRAVRPGLRREIRRCRRRAGQGSGGTAGSARPGPGIGQRGSAAVNRRATAVKRHSRAGANRPGIARFRNRVHKPGGHRDRHRVGRGHIRTVRHRQGEDMGHILRAVRPGLRREIRRCRRRAGQGSGGTAGSARPGPGIGQRGSAAVNRRATAVKRHSRAGANRPGIARFRNRVHKPGGHRDRHRVGRGHIRTVRHRQGEDMGHILRAVRPGLRREIRRCRRRAGQGSGGTAGSARPGPGIGQRGSAAVNRRATAVKRHSRAGANRPGIARFRNRVHKPGGHPPCRSRSIRTVRHRQGEDMGHVLRAVRPGLREIRRCRRRAVSGRWHCWFRPSGPRNRSEGFCGCQPSSDRRRAVARFRAGSPCRAIRTVRSDMGHRQRANCRCRSRVTFALSVTVRVRIWVTSSAPSARVSAVKPGVAVVARVALLVPPVRAQE